MIKWPLAVIVLLFLSGCGDTKTAANTEVVLFTSLDPIYSEAIAKEFEKRTNIRVKIQSDAEAAKTVGLANRLIARKEHPEADVFWNSELGQTLVLKEKGVLEKFTPQSAAEVPAAFKDADGFWTGFGARARVILYNTDLVKDADAPKSIEDLTDPRFKDKVVIARPIFGTTFSHAAALFAVWGPEKAKQFFRKLKENGAVLAAGNAMARNLVASGEKAVCITDTDDANGALLKGAHVKMVYPDADGIGTMLIPNSVSLIRNGPNPEAGRKLLEFIASNEVEGLLSRSESVQMPLREKVPAANPEFHTSKLKPMSVDWRDVTKMYPEVKTFFENELVW
jgi:iron(III) transport system substrate-binding protein